MCPFSQRRCNAGSLFLPGIESAPSTQGGPLCREEAERPQVPLKGRPRLGQGSCACLALALSFFICEMRPKNTSSAQTQDAKPSYRHARGRHEVEVRGRSGARPCFSGCGSWDGNISFIPSWFTTLGGKAWPRSLWLDHNPRQMLLDLRMKQNRVGFTQWVTGAR